MGYEMAGSLYHNEEPTVKDRTMLVIGDEVFRERSIVNSGFSAALLDTRNWDLLAFSAIGSFATVLRHDSTPRHNRSN